jgi:hypothetical protein
MELTDQPETPADAGLRPIGHVDLTRLRCSTEKIAPLNPWAQQLQGG